MQNRPLIRNIAAFIATLWIGTLHAQPTNSPVSTNTIVLPPSVPDPLERLNRTMWGLNKGILVDVIKPSGKVYRTVVPRPARTAVNHFGRNLLYPDRLLNNLLEGKWDGAGDETARFICNTVFGIGGLFDVATRWNVPISDAAFGDTFGQWGWHPQFFLMIPILGPSNDRDGVGLIGDALANPLTYFSPYTYITYGIDYNALTDQVDDYVRFAQSENDPYSLIQYAWTFVRRNKIVNFRVEGKQDQPSLETLQSVYFTFDNPEFPNWAKNREVYLPATGKKLSYSVWLQPKKAPMVYIIPGLGSHRLADTSLALAELAYKNGFSAVCVSSPYNAEFMQEASTAAMPAYSPIDCNDLHVALTEIDRALTKAYPGRLQSRALMGYSMGGFETLYIAATQTNSPTPLLHFDRYVAINTPVRLLYGISKLDQFYNAPLGWPASNRTDKIENTFLKVSALSKRSLRPRAGLPFDAIESEFLIGLNFRFILRDIIYSSQSRHNQGVLHEPLDTKRREPVYDEIMQYSYADYFNKFVVPYYQSRGIDLTRPDFLEQASNLRSLTNGLRGNAEVRLVENEDDFLLPPEDLAWLQATFTPEQMTIFLRGGHLGNLSHPAVQKAVLAALEELRAVPQGKNTVAPPSEKKKDAPALPAIP